MAIFITAQLKGLGFHFGEDDLPHWSGACRISTSNPIHPKGPNIPADVLSSSEHEVIFVKRPADLKRYGLTYDAAVALENTGVAHKAVGLDVASVRVFKLGERSFIGALLILREDVYDILDGLLRTIPRDNMAVMLSMDFAGFGNESSSRAGILSIQQFLMGTELVKATKLSLEVGPTKQLPLQSPRGTQMEPRTPTERF